MLKYQKLYIVQPHKGYPILRLIICIADYYHCSPFVIFLHSKSSAYTLKKQTYRNPFAHKLYLLTTYFYCISQHFQLSGKYSSQKCTFDNITILVTKASQQKKNLCNFLDFILKSRQKGYLFFNAKVLDNRNGSAYFVKYVVH